MNAALDNLVPNGCFHCGESIPKGFKAKLSIQSKTQEFCCYGCMAIAEMIVTDGLENFYLHRTSLANKPKEFSQSQKNELKLYDDSELQKDFVHIIDSSREATLSVSGITCAACIWLLEKELKQLPGIESFSINHSTHKAILRWQPESTLLSDALLRIRHLGYKAFPYQESQANALAQKERRSTVFRIAVAGIAAMQNMMFSVPLYLGIYTGIDGEFVSLFRWVSMLMSLPVVFFAALPFYRAAWRSLKVGHLTMDTPVSIAIIAAFSASAFITLFTDANIESDVYFDSVAMFAFFLLLGRFLEMQTRHKHLNSDAEISALLPATAIALIDEAEQSIPSHKIKIDDLLVVSQGQTVPADGFIVDGSSRFDESALTGEFLPVLKSLDDKVSAGTANVENTITLRVTAPPQNSRVSAIIRLLDKALSEKPATVITADRVASYFVAFVLLATVCTGVFWYYFEPSSAFSVVLAVLVVTCPCALSLATPTALTTANTALRKHGFLITKSHVLEALTSTTDIIFDKTGTLTEGKLRLAHTDLYGQYDEAQALAIAAALEAHSSHPIAKVFKPFFAISAKQVSSVLGKGLKGQVNGRDYWLGTRKYACGTLDDQTKHASTPHAGLSIYLSNGKQLLARFLLEDTVRSEARSCITALQRNGIEVHILSGDHEFSVRHTALELGIDKLKAAQSPEDKLSYVKALQAKGKHVTMIGDGINDLPVLSGARLSIAMGSASDITKLNSDAILLNEHMDVLTHAFQTARKGRRIIKQNIGWAIGYNLTMLPLAACGLVPPYFAALGMSLSSLFVVFNSLRLRA